MVPWITVVLVRLDHPRAGGVHHRHAERLQALQIFDRRAEGGHDHHVVGAELLPRARLGGLAAQEAHSLGAQVLVNARIVDDRGDQPQRAACVPAPRLLDHRERAVHPPAEAEGRGQHHLDLAEAQRSGCAQPLDQRAAPGEPHFGGVETAHRAKAAPSGAGRVSGRSAPTR
jgi:hypothetical protein